MPTRLLSVPLQYFPLLQGDDPAEGLIKRIQSGPGFGLGRFGWGLAKGAAKLTATTLCTVAIAALADKHFCHTALDSLSQLLSRNQVHTENPSAGSQHCQTTE